MLRLKSVLCGGNLPLKVWFLCAKVLESLCIKKATKRSLFLQVQHWYVFSSPGFLLCIITCLVFYKCIISLFQLNTLNRLFSLSLADHLKTLSLLYCFLINLPSLSLIICVSLLEPCFTKSDIC